MRIDRAVLLGAWTGAVFYGLPWIHLPGDFLTSLLQVFSEISETLISNRRPTRGSLAVFSLCTKVLWERGGQGRYYR